MRLAPRMIQSMEILQLPMLALEERIEQELESNITLETAEPGSEGPPEDGARVEAPESTGDESLDIDETGAKDFERLESMEKSYGEAFDNEYSAAGLRQSSDYTEGTYSASRMAGERDGKMDAMANTAARGPSFTDQLLEQWSWAETTPEVREAGELLISFIDTDGYIHTDLEAIADRAPATGSGVKPSVDALERALKTLQAALEPPGLAARNTRECLLLQIEAIEREHPEEDLSLVKTLVAEHLEDLAQNRLPKVSQKTGLPIETIKAALAWMQRLTVSPGRALVNESPPAIIPDAVIEYDDEEDRYYARLNDGRLPLLRINEAYAKMARDRSVERSTREFVRTNLSNAQWLIDAVNQRNQTVLRVINVVAEAQRDYFEQGPQALRPLPMTQVADQLGVHVATVSRAVAGKYVQTPRGVVALRSFFSGGTQTEGGDDVSWEAVKAALQEIVDGEDKSNPLSDDALAEELKKRGIEIARRTVAKYRSQLGIASARMRKVY